MKKLTVAGIFSVLVIVASCGGDNPAGTSPVLPEYFPLQVGAWWEYDYSVVELEPDSGLSYEGYRHYEVISRSDSTYNVERLWYIWLWNHNVLPDTVVFIDTLTVVSTPDSVRMTSSDSTYDCKILDLPLEEGKTWNNVCTVLDLDAYVETPAGSFEDCAEILEYWADDYYCYYHKMYCPDIGLVEFNAYDVHPDPYGAPEITVDIFYELTGSSYLR